MTKCKLTEDDLKFFKDNGFIHIKGYFDMEKDIVPLLRDIHRLIDLTITETGHSVDQLDFSPETFDASLVQSMKRDRQVAATVYDCVKKLPRFSSLVNDSRHVDTAAFLLETDFPGFAARGWGMRMDHAGEDKYITPLHQDYISQLCSPRGIVLWSPLRRVDKELGPVVLYPGSHKEGIIAVEKGGSRGYDLRVKNADKVLECYEAISPEINVGDMVIIDYLLLHKSSPNISKTTRWSMICRYFDFNDSTGSSYGWKGGDQEGNSFEDFHGSLVS